MNETRLRALLRAEADAYRPGAPRKLPSRRRLAPTVALATACAAVAVVAAALDHWTAPQTSRPAARDGVVLELTGYERPGPDGRVPSELRSHVACMRAHGFDLPEPEWTGAGWTMRIDDAGSFGIGSRRWKKTVFGACALVRDRATYRKWVRSAALGPRRHPSAFRTLAPRR